MKFFKPLVIVFILLVTGNAIAQEGGGEKK